MTDSQTTRPAQTEPTDGRWLALIVLCAATLGSTRLIDNVDVTPKDGED